MFQPERLLSRTTWLFLMCLCLFVSVRVQGERHQEEEGDGGGVGGRSTGDAQEEEKGESPNKPFSLTLLRRKALTLHVNIAKISLFSWVQKSRVFKCYGDRHFMDSQQLWCKYIYVLFSYNMSK